MGYASKDKKPLKDLVILDDASVAAIADKLVLTPEQIASIASQVSGGTGGSGNGYFPQGW